MFQVDGSGDDNTFAARMRRGFHGLRTEGAGTEREAIAVAVGAFIGCLPVYGFHLVMCWGIGRLFRLNRLKIYLAANISNPLVAPWLLLAELQAGSILRNGSFQSMSPQAMRLAGLTAIGGDLIVGSLAVGGLLALIAGAAAYTMGRAAAGDPAFTEIARRAAERYIGASATAWEFARSKLRNDPIYRATLLGGLLPSGGLLLDVGCGQGLTLALLAEAGRIADEGAWPPSLPIPPRFDRLVGIEIRPRIAALARAALNRDAQIVHADAGELIPDRARAVLLFNVLHLMDHGKQDAMLAALAKTLDRRGVILVRDADASAGWRFLAVRIGNFLKGLAAGRRRQQFCFRTRVEWLACFARHGFRADVRPMSAGTPFANVLFHLTVQSDGPGSSLRDGPPA